MSDPISDEALGDLIVVDVPDWERNPNRPARAFRMADHVAPLIGRLLAAELDRDRLASEIREWQGKATGREIRAQEAEASRDRHAALLEKLRPYLRHRGDCERGPCDRNADTHDGVCPNHPDGPVPCDCGLVDLLTEIPGEEAP